MLKTGEIMLKIQLYIAGINYMLRHIHVIKQVLEIFIILFHNITVFTVFVIK